MPPIEYPVETILRAFALYMDHHHIGHICEHLGISESTLRVWRKDTLAIKGVTWDWKEARDLVDVNRGLLDAHDAEYRQKKWLEYTSGFDHDAAEDLRRIRKEIVSAVEGGEVELKAGDLPKIVQTEMLLQGKATKIVEINRSLTMIIGKAVAEAAARTIRDPNMRELLLDEVQQSLYRMQTNITDEKALEAATPEYEEEADFEELPAPRPAGT